MMFLFAAALLLTQAESTDDPIPPALIQAKKAEIERQASAAVRSALLPICLGRCELLGVDVEVEAHKKLVGAMPGFERDAKMQIDITAKSLTVSVAADQKLTPATRSGLTQAVKAAVVGFSPNIDVALKPFDFPQPRNEAAAPIIISMSKTDGERAPAAATLPTVLAPPPPPPLTPLERLLGALADAAPTLLGIVLVTLCLLGLLWFWRRPRPVVVEPTVEKETEAEIEALKEEEAAALASPLLVACSGNRRLRCAVVRELLLHSDERSAEALRFLGPEALSDFHSTSLAPHLARAYALLREKSSNDETRRAALTELEQLIADELSDGAPDARFYQLELIEPPVFVAVIQSLGEQDRVHLLTTAPRHLRAAYLRTLSEQARHAFFATVLDVGEKPKADVLDVLATRLAHQIDEKNAAYANARGVAGDIGDELEGLEPAAQARLMHSLAQKKLLWSEVASEQVVSDQQIVEASDDVVDALLVSAPPEAVVVFLHSTSAEVRLRLQGKLPSYLKALYAAETQRELSEQEVKRARASVFRVFRRLSRDTLPPPPANVSVAK